MSVNVENMRKWVEALRSGKYPQARGVLRSTAGGYCCLGVACAISDLGTWRQEEYWVFDTGASRSAMILPEPVTSWLGLDQASERGDVLLDANSSAVELNDSGKSFSQIADAIERTYLTEDNV